MNLNKFVLWKELLEHLLSEAKEYIDDIENGKLKSFIEDKSYTNFVFDKYESNIDTKYIYFSFYIDNNDANESDPCSSWEAVTIGYNRYDCEFDYYNEEQG